MSPEYRLHVRVCEACKAGRYCGLLQAIYQDDLRDMSSTRSMLQPMRLATEVERSSMNVTVDADGYPLMFEYAGRNFKLEEM